MAEGKGGLTKNEKQILKPVIKKIKADAFLQRHNRLKRQREKLGIKLKPKAKGPNPMSVKKSYKTKGKNTEEGSA